MPPGVSKGKAKRGLGELERCLLEKKGVSSRAARAEKREDKRKENIQGRSPKVREES
jgi:hypothetical protein